MTDSRDSLERKMLSPKNNYSLASPSKHRSSKICGCRILPTHESVCLFIYRRRKILKLCLILSSLILLVFSNILNIKAHLKPHKISFLYENDLSFIEPNNTPHNKTNTIKDQVVSLRQNTNTGLDAVTKKRSKNQVVKNDMKDNPKQTKATNEKEIQKRSSPHPRVIFLSSGFPSKSMNHEDKNERDILEVSLENIEYKGVSTEKIQETFQVSTRKSKKISKMELIHENENSSCEPMRDWHTQFHPTCNFFHEIDLVHWSSWMNPRNNQTYLNFLGQGNFRIVWDVDQIAFGGTQNKTHVHVGGGSIDAASSIVLKQWKFEHDFKPQMYEFNRADAIIMDKLTFSPYIIQMYGGCGLSVLTEFAAGSLTASVRKSTSLDKVRLMQQVAEGLAHIHEIDGPNEQPSIIHNDINLGHIVIGKNGLPLFNDFNIAIFRRWDKDTHNPCSFNSQHPSPQWRSPEEIRNYANMTHSNLTEKIDIYALGNIFHRLAVGERPWRKGHGSITESYIKEIEIMKYNGTTPPIPDKIRNSKDPGIQKLLKMSYLCYRFDPEKRPSAREISQNLDAFVKKVDDILQRRKEASAISDETKRIN